MNSAHANHKDRAHAKYGSSRIHRVLACAGYVHLASRVKHVVRDEAEEGTKAHELLAAYLNGNRLIINDCNKDEALGIRMVEDFIESVYIAHGPHVVMYVEQPLTFPQDVVPPEDAAGIADVMLYDPIEQIGWSIEYKFGHVFVSEKRNPQLMFNAVARWWNTPLKEVRLVVVQPFSHGAEQVRVDVVPGYDLAQFQIEVCNEIRYSEVVIEHANAGEAYGHALRPGRHCRFCEAELICPAREQQAVSVIDSYARTIKEVDGLPLPELAEMDNARLAYVLRNADALRSWLKAAENEAHRRAMDGQDVPEHKIVEAQARRELEGDTLYVSYRLAELTDYHVGPEEFTETKLLGVVKIENMLTAYARDHAPKGEQRKAVREMKERLAFLTPKKSSGNLVLAPITDSRPAVNRIASGFSGVSLPPISGE